MTRAWFYQLWTNIRTLLRHSAHQDSARSQASEQETGEVLRVAQGFMARYRNALRELGR